MGRRLKILSNLFQFIYIIKIKIMETITFSATLLGLIFAFSSYEKSEDRCNLMLKKLFATTAIG